MELKELSHYFILTFFFSLVYRNTVVNLMT